MLNEIDIENKSQLELLQQLVGDLRAGDMRQIRLLTPLIKASLLVQEKIKVEEIIQGLYSPFIENSMLNVIDIMVVRIIMKRLGYGDIDFSKAIEVHDQEIALGNAVAMSHRASMYMDTTRQDGEVNFAEAIVLLERAIELGHCNSMFKRAVLYTPGREDYGVDIAKAIDLFEQAISLGHDAAMFNRAMMLYAGECGQAVDLGRAIVLFDQAITLGNAQAMYFRAQMYHLGKGVVVDFNKAIGLFDQAIKLGNTDAMFGRSLMYLDLKVGEIDFPNAIALLEQGIALGSAKAMYLRSQMYLNGKGAPIEVAKALRLHRRAVEIIKDIPPLKSENLSNQDKKIHAYHMAMSKNDTVKAVDLLINDFDLVTEFIEIDCKYLFMSNQSHLQRIKAVIERCIVMSLDKHKQNELYVLVLMALDGCEKELGYKKLGPVVINDLLRLKKGYLVEMKFDDIKSENLPAIMQLVIDTWNGFMNDGWTDETVNFTQNAALILSHAMYKLKLLNKEEESRDFLKNIATILLKSMYGERCTIRFGFSVSIEQVMLLMAFSGLPIKPPLSLTDLNRALGSEGLCYEYVPREQIPSPVQTSLNEPCSMDADFALPSTDLVRKRVMEPLLVSDSKKSRLFQAGAAHIPSHTETGTVTSYSLG